MNKTSKVSNEEKTTFLPDRSLVVIPGAKNTGKTFAAVTVARPSHMDRVYYDDAERSGNRVVSELESNDLHFGFYNDLESRFSGDLPNDEDLLHRINEGQLPWASSRELSALEHYWAYVMESLDKNLTPGNFDVYIHDTLGKLEAGMAAWVEKRKGFGEGKAGWTTTSYGRMWTEGVYPLYEQFVESIFSRGVRVVVLTSHLKTPWTEGSNPKPIQGKVEPQGKKILYQLSTLMVWLVKSARNADGAPAGLVLKERLGRLTIQDGKWKPRRMLPERIPHFAWWGFGEERDSVEWYLENGVDLANPRDDEKMNQDEREMVSELMTSEQMKLMTMQYEAEAAREKARARQFITQNTGNGIAVSSKEVMDMVGRVRDLGVSEDNQEEVVNTLVSQSPPPLREKVESWAREAIEIVLGEG